MTSPQIRRIVELAYRDRLEVPAQWTGRHDEFIEMQAARLSRQVAELAEEMGEQALQRWTAGHQGEHPDYLTHQGLLNTARASAMEIVLDQELYEPMGPPPEPEPVEPPTPSVDRRQVGWEQRWIDSEMRSEPDETLEALAEVLWPDPAYSVMFRIKAGYLLAARAEDGLALPAQQGDPLARQLTPLVYADLERDGHPPR